MARSWFRGDGALGEWTALSMVVLVAGLSGCSVDANADRAAWLHSTLVADRYGDLRRNPALVEDQFDRMQEDLYLYMRGTLPQFRRDIAEPFAGLADATESAFLSKDSSLVQLVGDPHVENIGSFLSSSGDQVVEFNDFDAAIYGPYHLDVWRLALSWYALGASSSFTRTREQDWLDVAQEVARGYASEMVAAASGEPADLAENVVFIDLLQEAQQDGEELAFINRYTEVSDQGRREFVVDGVELGAADPSESRWIDESLPAWLVSMPERSIEVGPLKSVARRFGSGVASLFLYRYYLLFEGASELPEDDVLVEWKETRDPCLIGTGLVEGARLFESNGKRITVFERSAHADPNSDGLAGWVGDEPWSFRSRRNSGFQLGIDRERIVKRLRDGRWVVEDLEQAAFAMGQLLARSHARAPSLLGNTVSEAVAATFRGREQAFATETRERIAAMGPRLVDDFRLFALLRKDYGPRLDPMR